MLCQAGRSSFVLVFRGGHLRHGPGMHIRAHEPGEKFPCRRGKSCAPGAPCHTSSGLLGPGFWPFGKQGCSGLLPSQQQQQQLSPAPDTSLLPVPWHWPDPKSHCWHNSCQGRTEHCGHRTGPGCARCHQPGSAASVRQAPHGHLPKGWEEGGCKTPRCGAEPRPSPWVPGKFLILPGLGWRSPPCCQPAWQRALPCPRLSRCRQPSSAACTAP